MKRPPEWFIRSLSALDSLLSVRWGETMGMWVIERRAVIPQSELEFLQRHESRLNIASHSADSDEGRLKRNQKKWISVREERVSAESGKRVIFTSPVLSNAVFTALCHSDIQRYGGYARFADAMEAEESAAITDRQRMIDNQTKAVNGEVYDILQFVHRRKGALLDRNEQDLRYLLHGTRTTPESAPLIANV